MSAPISETLQKSDSLSSEDYSELGDLGSARYVGLSHCLRIEFGARMFYGVNHIELEIEYETPVEITRIYWRTRWVLTLLLFISACFKISKRIGKFRPLPIRKKKE